MFVWIFDLDGVVTDVSQKKITNPKILEYFSKFMQKGEPVAINTGRSLEFIRKEVFSPMLDYLKTNGISEDLLNNFFAVGEKGNAWIENEKDYYDKTISVPKEFTSKVKELIEKGFSDTMFFDNTKKTIISIEMNKGFALERFNSSKEKLLPKLEKLLKEENLENAYKIKHGTIAIDIQDKSAGKKKGMKRILEWLSRNSLKPEKIFVFGDSLEDLEMGEKLSELNLLFTFVFVGNPAVIKDKPNFPIIFTKEKYDIGTEEYLSSSPN